MGPLGGLKPIPGVHALENILAIYCLVHTVFTISHTHTYGNITQYTEETYADMTRT